MNEFVYKNIFILSCVCGNDKSIFDKQVNYREGRITMILSAKSFHNKDKIQRAKIGLQLFLSILIITSIILNVVVIITKSMPLIVVYMFTPALSSILTRIILKEGFKDVSFSLGNLKIWKGIGFALLIL